MNYIRMKKLLLLFVVLFQICQIKAQEIVEFKKDEFPISSIIEGRIIETDILSNPLEMNGCDSLVFISNKKCSKVIDVLNLNTGKIVSKFGIIGRGPSEMISPFGFQVLENEKVILVKDHAQRKVFYYSIPKILGNCKDNFIRSISLNGMLTKWAKQVNDTIYCSLIGHEKLYDHACIPTEKPQDVSFFGKFPDIGHSYDPLVASNLFSVAMMDFSPDGIYMIEAYHDFNRIRVYENRRHTVSISGDEYTNLSFGKQNGELILSRNNYDCYENVFCAKDYFIAVYCGKKYDLSVPFRTFSDLYFFKYDGTPLKHLVLDHSINEIAIDTENQIIWGIDKSMEPILIRFDYE